MLIVFFILFLLTTQNIQNKVEEHSLLSFCFLTNSTLQNKTSECKIKGKNDKKCQNCNKISLICYKGRCISGPSQNHI